MCSGTVVRIAGKMSAWSFLRSPQVRQHPVRLGSRRVLLEVERRLGGGWPVRERVAEIAPGVRMHLRLDDLIERHIYVYGLFEYEVVTAMMSLLTPGMNVADVGANVGQYSLLAASRVGSAGTVLAFEPNPPVFERLRRNVELNEFTNVRTESIALAATAGAASLHVPLHDQFGAAGWASLGAFSGVPEQEIPIEVATLDQRAAEHGLEIGLVKIDVEGFEADVLRGASEVLRRSHPVVIFEVHSVRPDGGADEIDLLRASGYGVFRIAVNSAGRVQLAALHEGEDARPAPTSADWEAINLVALHPEGPRQHAFGQPGDRAP